MYKKMTADVDIVCTGYARVTDSGDILKNHMSSMVHLLEMKP